MQSDTTEPRVTDRIRELRHELPGPAFFILDSNHTKKHVLSELTLVRSVTIPGDYVIVEDSNINGHPVLPKWGDGPYEALHEYIRMYPNDYELDVQREKKFGFTFAPSGFLVRK